jgi:hypothetical protein
LSEESRLVNKLLIFVETQEASLNTLLLGSPQKLVAYLLAVILPTIHLPGPVAELLSRCPPQGSSSWSLNDIVMAEALPTEA